MQICIKGQISELFLTFFNLVRQAVFTLFFFVNFLENNAWIMMKKNQGYLDGWSYYYQINGL